MAELDLFVRAARMRILPKVAGLRPKMVRDWEAACWTSLGQPDHVFHFKWTVGRHTILEKILVTYGHFRWVPRQGDLKGWPGLL